MPIFEYLCNQCGNSFEKLVLNSRIEESLVCPACQSKEVKKKISVFAAKAPGGKSTGFWGGAPAASSCNSGSV